MKFASAYRRGIKGGQSRPRRLRCGRACAVVALSEVGPQVNNWSGWSQIPPDIHANRIPLRLSAASRGANGGHRRDGAERRLHRLAVPVGVPGPRLDSPGWAWHRFKLHGTYDGPSTL